MWTDPAATEQNIAWTRSTYNGDFDPRSLSAGGSTTSNDDDPEDAVRSAFGPNYDRLVEVKRRYDPENIFRSNHNIDPSA